MVTRSFTIYKGYRIFLLEDDDFRKDTLGRYAVSVHIEKPELQAWRRIEVPECYAATLEEAQQVSVKQAMLIIDGSFDPSGREGNTPKRRAIKGTKGHN